MEPEKKQGRQNQFVSVLKPSKSTPSSCAYAAESKKSSADTTISSLHYQAPIQATPIHIVSPQSFDFESRKRIGVSEGGGLGDVSQSKKIRVSESEVVAVGSLNLNTDGVEAHKIDVSENQLRKFNKGKKFCEDNYSDGNLDSCSIGEEISNIKYIVGNGNGLLRNHVGVERRGKTHQQSNEVIEKNMGVEHVVDDETVESNNGSLELLDLLKFVQGQKYGYNSEDVDFSGITTKQGLIFLRPRWWPPEGDEW